MRMKLIFLFFIVLICIIILLQIAYKLLDFGNNINKSDLENILNISSYEAIIEVEIYSNKNTNKYILKQEYLKPNIFRQEVIEPDNIKGLTTIYDGRKLTLENKSLSLKTIYENYGDMVGNSLSLVRFIEEYNNIEKKEIEENEEETIVIVKTNESKYKTYKKLYISNDTNLPTKMEILDINQNITVYILYNEISLNKVNKEEILND